MNLLTLLKQTLGEHLRLVLLAIALFLTGVVSFRALLITSAREIVYDGRVSMSYCTPSGICYARYELAVGNTGSSPQDEVVADIRIDPAKWSTSHQIQNIAADRARANDPELRLEKSDDGYLYTLDRFAAGAEFLLTLECRLCTAEDIKLAKDATVEIRANGTVLKGDPRVTPLARRLSRLL